MSCHFHFSQKLPAIIENQTPSVKMEISGLTIIPPDYHFEATYKKYEILIDDFAQLRGRKNSNNDLEAIARSYYEQVNHVGGIPWQEKDLIILLQSKIDNFPMWSLIVNNNHYPQKMISGDFINLVLAYSRKCSPEERQRQLESIYSLYIKGKIDFSSENDVAGVISNSSKRNLLGIVETLFAFPDIAYSKSRIDGLFTTYLNQLGVEKDLPKKMRALFELEDHILLYYPQLVNIIGGKKVFSQLLSAHYKGDLIEKENVSLLRSLKKRYHNINDILEVYLVYCNKYMHHNDSLTKMERFKEIVENDLWNNDKSQKSVFSILMRELENQEFKEFLEKNPNYQIKFSQIKDSAGNTFAHMINNFFPYHLEEYKSLLPQEEHNNFGIPPHHTEVIKKWQYTGNKDISIAKSFLNFSKKDLFYAKNGDTPLHELVRFVFNNKKEREERGFWEKRERYQRWTYKNKNVLLDFDLDSNGNHLVMSHQEKHLFEIENIRFIKEIGSWSDYGNQKNGEPPLFTLIREIKKKYNFDLRKKGVKLFLLVAQAYLYKNKDNQGKTAADLLFELAPNLSAKTIISIKTYQPKEQETTE